MLGWEKFGKLTDNRQIRQYFPPPYITLYGIYWGVVNYMNLWI